MCCLCVTPHAYSCLPSIHLKRGHTCSSRARIMAGWQEINLHCQPGRAHALKQHLTGPHLQHQGAGWQYIPQGLVQVRVHTCAVSHTCPTHYCAGRCLLAQPLLHCPHTTSLRAELRLVQAMTGRTMPPTSHTTLPRTSASGTGPYSLESLDRVRLSPWWAGRGWSWQGPGQVCTVQPARECAVCSAALQAP